MRTCSKDYHEQEAPWSWEQQTPAPTHEEQQTPVPTYNYPVDHLQYLDSLSSDIKIVVSQNCIALFALIKVSAGAYFRRIGHLNHISFNDPIMEDTAGLKCLTPKNV